MTELAAADGFFVRPAGENDLNYVRKTWLREYAENAEPSIEALGGAIPYFVHHARARDAAMQRGAVTIVSRSGIPDGICGFAVTELAPVEEMATHILHFVFVKARWRGHGIARLLLAPLLDRHVRFTHRTRSLDVARLPRTWSFNPYLFLRSA